MSLEFAQLFHLLVGFRIELGDSSGRPPKNFLFCFALELWPLFDQKKDILSL